MNFLKIASAMTMSIAFAAPVLAEDAAGEGPSFEPAAMSTLTRAEVLADLQAWRESGMAELQAGEATPDPFDVRYQSAAQRYAALRSEQRVASSKSK